MNQEIYTVFKDKWRVIKHTKTHFILYIIEESLWYLVRTSELIINLLKECKNKVCISSHWLQIILKKKHVRGVWNII